MRVMSGSCAFIFDLALGACGVLRGNHCESVPSFGHSPFMLQFLIHFILSIRPFSLLVMKIPSLTSLGLHSLREISDGSVYITQNINLCFYYTVDWIQIFTGNRRQLRRRNNDIKENKPQIKCGQLSSPIIGECVLFVSHMYVIMLSSIVNLYTNNFLLCMTVHV